MGSPKLLQVVSSKANRCLDGSRGGSDTSHDSDLGNWEVVLGRLGIKEPKDRLESVEVAHCCSAQPSWLLMVGEACWLRFSLSLTTTSRYPRRDQDCACSPLSCPLSQSHLMRPALLSIESET